MTVPLNPPGDPLSDVTRRLARGVLSLGPGDRAALRRMDPEGPPPLAFVRLAIEYLPEGWHHRRAAWQSLARAISLLAGIEGPPLRLGEALARASYSELRLQRLLSASGPTARRLLLGAVRFLAAAMVPVSWTDLARFLLTEDADKRQALSLEIAESYYRTLSRAAAAR